MNKPEERIFLRTLTSQSISMVRVDKYKEDSLWVTIRSVNISQNGILFESPYTYPVGEKQIIRINENDRKFHDEEVEIIRVEEVITDTHYNIGARFLNPKTNIMTKLIH